MNENAYGAKSENLILCVFTDHIQILKKRNSVANKHLSSAASVANLRSPALSRRSMIGGHIGGTSQKPYKYADWINFSDIKKVIDVTDS